MPEVKKTNLDLLKEATDKVSTTNPRIVKLNKSITAGIKQLEDAIDRA
jgi:hypothetical protein